MSNFRLLLDIEDETMQSKHPIDFQMKKMGTKTQLCKMNNGPMMTRIILLCPSNVN